jgi:hypothetical protein
VPEGEGDGVNRVCRVEKPVYGMAQAGRRWQRALFPWLNEWSDGKLQQSTADTCIFHFQGTNSTPDGPRVERLIVGCYVDDLFVLSSHDDEHSVYSAFTRDLSLRWDVEDEGEVSDLLSIEIEPSDGHVMLHQRKYVDKLMKTYAPDGPPKSHSRRLPPCDSSLVQHQSDSMLLNAEDIDPVLVRKYQSLCGALLYCAVNTRPDVAYAVGMLCRSMARPTPELHEDALRVLYYLHYTADLGLRYQADNRDVGGMSDSDWATRYSTTGWLFTYSQAAITWGSKKQVSVALSSCEAEIVALSEASKEVAYLRRFMEELGLGSDGPTSLATDNSAAQNLSYNPEHHERTKHIERRHFFVRDLVEDGQLVVPLVSTVDNLADFFTKALPPATFFRMRNAIMNVDTSRDLKSAFADGGVLESGSDTTVTDSPHVDVAAPGG